MAPLGCIYSAAGIHWSARGHHRRGGAVGRIADARAQTRGYEAHGCKRRCIFRCLSRCQVCFPGNCPLVLGPTARVLVTLFVRPYHRHRRAAVHDRLRAGDDRSEMVGNAGVLSCQPRHHAALGGRFCGHDGGRVSGSVRRCQVFFRHVDQLGRRLRRCDAFPARLSSGLATAGCQRRLIPCCQRARGNKRQ